jgi:uncharacterized membrane protein
MMESRRFLWGAVAVWAGAAVFVGLYIWLDFNKLHALRVGSDTGSYLQAALNFLHHGSTFDYGDWRPEMAQHDQWMFLVLVPFVAAWPHPETVIVIQVLAVGLAAPVLYALGRRFGANGFAAAAVAFAYLLSPSIQGFAYGDFVPLDFVPLLGFGLAIAARARSLVWSLVFAQMLTGTKEDVALFVLWFGLAGAILYDRRIGGCVTALCALNVGLYELAEHATRVHTVRPQYALSDPQWPKQVAFFLEILAPFAFAPLALGRRVLLAAPLVAELVFAQNWPFPLFQAGTYYSIALITLIGIGSAYALARVPGFARAMPATAIVMALFFNVTVLHFGRRPFAADPQYDVARAWGARTQTVVFPCEDQGAWVVAASNPDARLAGCDPRTPLRRDRPAWRDAPLASNGPWTRGPQ